ncbi:Metallo-dependent phosphatase-like protein [Globomyces pollinis-pini]|nr:Metallo-dependent phosphatase-like protein [Globomyces pollinis-pini]
MGKLFSLMMTTQLLPLHVSDDDREKAEQLKSVANKHFANHDYENAIDFYTQAISFNPKAPAYFSNRSIAHFKMELYGAALSDATEAIQLDPNFVKAYYRRASANMALGKLKESIKDFRQVIKLAPTDPGAREKLSVCQKELKRIEFEKAIFVEVTTTTILDQLGDFNSIVVEDSYEGPHLPAQGVSLEFAQQLLEHLKDQKKLHRKYVLQILVAFKTYIDARPPIEDVFIPDNAKLTVCGDIHGQFYDLLNVFKLNGLPSPDNMYLWNGDFVDRGSFSFECVITLFVFKLLYPDAVYLTRGNHEADDMNRVYGFEGEVKHKYSELTFKLFSNVFNGIPIGNLIMNKILVIHGGLFSSDDVTLADLRKIDRFKQPGSTGLMCELLWSDPQVLPGRSPSKRGVGIQFGPDVTKNFLEKNDLKMIIRSHEVKHEGYEIQHNGNLVTIFSAPNYCDAANNFGAYIHITPDLECTYHKFKAVPHPDVPAMKYAGLYGSM